MNIKKTNAPTNTETQNMKEMSAEVGNIYETLMIIAKRANQISRAVKEELNQKLKDFASVSDNLEEIFENREQIEISKFYERLPKPVLIALEEFKNDKIYYRRGTEEEDAQIPTIN